MFCYTSGTTGDPKAAMLSHGNLVSVSAAANLMDVNCNETDSVISYLPLAHSFEKCVFCFTSANGCKYGFYSGDPLKLFDDLQVLKPTLFPSVPRLFNRIYDKIQAGVKDKGKV
jgi:long-chain acyl-CoA synthetase